MFYAIFGNIIRWSYGYKLMTIPHEEEEAGTGNEPVLPIAKTYSNSGNTTNHLGYDSLTMCPPAPITNSDNELAKPRQRSESVSSELSSFDRTLTADESEHYRTLTENISTVTLAPSEHAADTHQPRKQSQDTNGSTNPNIANERSPLLSFPSLPTESGEVHHHHHSTSPLAKYPAGRYILSAYARISKYFTPPLLAALAALFVGLTPLKPILFDKHRFLYPSLTKAIESCGSVAVPIILVCLGAQLAGFSMRHHCSSPDMKKPMAAAVCVRMLLMPLLVIPIVTLFIAYGEGLSTLASDPVFAVVMIMLGCAPTAINLVQMTQVYPNFFEEEMLRVLFWNYGVLCTPLMTIVVLVGLQVVQNVT